MVSYFVVVATAALLLGALKADESADFIQVGDCTDYTPSSAVSAGDVVVQGQLFGVAKKDIAANVKGALYHIGVFDLPKGTSTDSALTMGARVYWDAVNGVVTATVGSNVYIGKTVEAVADAASKVKTRLDQ